MMYKVSSPSPLLPLPSPLHPSPPLPSPHSSRPSSTKAMQLKKKGGDVDMFVDRIISEGGTVSSFRKDAPKAALKSTPASQHGRWAVRVGL